MTELTLRVDSRLYAASRRIAEGPRVTVKDPWRGDTLSEVTMATPDVADEATAASVRAFEAMRRLSSYERRKLLLGIARGLEARAGELSEILAREIGKPMAFARLEVSRAIQTFTLGAEEAVRLGGGVEPLDVTERTTGFSGYWQRVPVGPVLAIAPFNFPLNLVAHKVAPALACGASVLVKPPPQAPLCSLVLAEIVRAAGAPDDALQVLPCAVEVAEQLVSDERFKTLSFTGSAKVGWAIKARAGKKRVLLELGGNASVILHEDEPDLERAIDRIFVSAFGFAGQVCIKTQRLFVHETVADQVIEGLAARARATLPADPLGDTILGPMIDESNAKRVDSWVDEALVAGARPVVRGAREGARLGPSILAFSGPTAGIKVVDEEVFGPVLSVFRYTEWSDALLRADDSRYGLQAGIFTDSARRIREAFETLHVGALVVRDTPSFRVDSMPYGGTRDSGLGREGVRFALETMTEPKLLVFAS